MRSSALVVMLSSLAVAEATAQDLFERARGGGAATGGGSGKLDSQRGHDRGRLDLRLAPDFLPKTGSAQFGVKAGFDYDFACGDFDLKATYKSLVGKEAREELLKAAAGWLVTELAKSGMVLLCETSPTLCQALQHARVSASAMLKMNYDRCAVLEGAMDTMEKSVATNAMKACLEAEQKAGKTMDQALEACKKSDKVRSLKGERVAEFDLTKEVADALGLSSEVRSVLGILGGDTKVSARGLDASFDAKAVEKRFAAHRDAFAAAWRDVVAQVAARQPPSDADLASLVPKGSPTVSRDELATIAALPERERAIVIASIASVAAKVKLDEEIRDAERSYQAVAMTPTADANQLKALQERVEWLRMERRRLEEAYRSQRELNDALLAVRAVGQADVMKKAQAHYEAVKLRAVEKELRLSTRPYGTALPSLSRPEPAGSGPSAGQCPTGCTGSDFTWGSK